MFFVLDGECCTPPLAAGCLNGVTRQLVLEIGAARSASRSRSATSRSSSLRARRRGVRVVDRARGATDRRPSTVVALPAAPGPITERLAAAFADLVAATPTPKPVDPAASAHRSPRFGRRWMTSPAVTTCFGAVGAGDDEVALGGHRGGDAVEGARGPARPAPPGRASPSVRPRPATTRRGRRASRRGAQQPGDEQRRPGRPGPSAWRSHAVAMSAISGGNASERRLRPMPTTTAPTPPRRSAASARIPASLRSSTTRSFGHLSAGVEPARPPPPLRPRPRRPPASRGAGARAGGRAAGGSTRAAPRPARAVQVRPWRPRPAVCSSATATTPSRLPLRRLPPGGTDWSSRCR